MMKQVCFYRNQKRGVIHLQPSFRNKLFSAKSEFSYVHFGHVHVFRELLGIFSDHEWDFGNPVVGLVRLKLVPVLYAAKDLK